MLIRSITFLFLIQTLVSCQSGQGQLSVSEANIVAPPASNQQTPESTGPSTTDMIYQSTDGGLTWQDVSAGLPGKLEADAVFTTEGEVYVVGDGDLYHSAATNSVPVWEKAYLFGADHINSIFPGRSGLLVTSYGDGLFQNMGGADIWQPISTSLKDKLIRTVVETPAGAILVGTDNGIYKSADAGKSWKHVFTDRMILNLVISGDVLFGGGYAGVMRSTDGGENWEKVLDENILIKNTGLAGDRVVAVLGTHDANKVCPGGITSRLRLSADKGATWQRPEQAPLPVDGAFEMDTDLADVVDVYSLVQSGEYLFCSFNTGVYRSADQGKTWEAVISIKEKGMYHLAVSRGVIYALKGFGGC